MVHEDQNAVNMVHVVGDSGVNVLYIEPKLCVVFEFGIRQDELTDCITEAVKSSQLTKKKEMHVKKAVLINFLSMYIKIKRIKCQLTAVLLKHACISLEMLSIPPLHSLLKYSFLKKLERSLEKHSRIVRCQIDASCHH